MNILRWFFRFSSLNSFIAAWMMIIGLITVWFDTDLGLAALIGGLIGFFVIPTITYIILQGWKE